MKNIFQKSAMAIAVASLSVSAFAANWTGSDDEIVLANEVFGAGSEATLVATPKVVFNVTNGGSIADGETGTIKFTLNETAVFGENLSLISNWEASNATLEFTFNGGLVLNSANSYSDSGVTVVVDQGGEVDDNTVTFIIANTSGSAVTLESVEVEQFRTKNLTAPLARGVGKVVQFGAEFRNENGLTDTTPALTIFRSQNGVELTTTEVTNYEGTPGKRARIDVADTEFSFTGDGTPNAGSVGSGAAQDFDESDNELYVDLGNLSVSRTTIDSPTNFVKKENGDYFDFNGSDKINVTISSDKNLDAYSSIYLRTGPGAACGAVTNADFSASPDSGDNSVTISLTGETTVDLEAGYRLCAVAKGDVAIPESSFSAALHVEYFNPRYVESVATLEYGQILRNGCSVTLFNLPTTSVGDDAYIRLTNVSEKPGAVRASVWTEDGEQIDIGAQLVDTLEAHATVVLHTNEGQGNGVFLGDVLEDYSALTSGRHRIQLQGAFPACEAMGLIRTPAGVLVNMTSTTYSGDGSRLGSFTNGTSNTSN